MSEDIEQKMHINFSHCPAYCVKEGGFGASADPQRDDLGKRASKQLVGSARDKEARLVRWQIGVGTGSNEAGDRSSRWLAVSNERKFGQD